MENRLLSDDFFLFQASFSPLIYLSFLSAYHLLLVFENGTYVHYSLLEKTPLFSAEICEKPAKIAFFKPKTLFFADPAEKTLCFHAIFSPAPSIRLETPSKALCLCPELQKVPEKLKNAVFEEIFQETGVKMLEKSGFFAVFETFGLKTGYFSTIRLFELDFEAGKAVVRHQITAELGFPLAESGLELAENGDKLIIKPENVENGAFLAYFWLLREQRLVEIRPDELLFGRIVGYAADSLVFLETEDFLKVYQLTEAGFQAKMGLECGKDQKKTLFMRETCEKNGFLVNFDPEMRLFYDIWRLSEGVFSLKRGFRLDFLDFSPFWEDPGRVAVFEREGKGPGVGFRVWRLGCSRKTQLMFVLERSGRLESLGRLVCREIVEILEGD